MNESLLEQWGACVATHLLNSNDFGLTDDQRLQIGDQLLLTMLVMAKANTGELLRRAVNG